jgi:acyl-CoA thioesterase II
MTDRFTDLIVIDDAGDDRFVASPPGDGFLFGGLVMSLAVRAAYRTVETGRDVHSVHAYFLESGRWGEPIRLDVERTRDGRSFATRRITARQGDAVLAIVAASFHCAEEGEDWFSPLPPIEASPSEALPIVTNIADDVDPIEIRPIDDRHGLGHIAMGASTIHPYWCRTRQPLPDELAFHLCAVTFISDYFVVGAAGWPRSGIPSGTRTVTIDHSIWLHRPARADDWLLFTAEPFSIASARSLVHGTVRTPEGLLVASFVQEDLVRVARDPSRPYG